MFLFTHLIASGYEACIPKAECSRDDVSHEHKYHVTQHRPLMLERIKSLGKITACK